MEQIEWLLHSKLVSVADNAHFAPEYLPTARHRLFVKKALDILSGIGFNAPGEITIENLPWPIIPIVMPNHGRQPRWAAHRHHRHISSVPDQDKLSPFIEMNHGQRKPMTKALTIELIGTNEKPAIKNIYAGHAIQPLPWELEANGDEAAYHKSVEFWQQHSFLYDTAFVVHKLQEDAPKWYTTTISHSLLPR